MLIIHKNIHWSTKLGTKRNQNGVSKNKASGLMISTVNRAFILHNFGTVFGKNQNQIPIGI